MADRSAPYGQRLEADDGNHAVVRARMPPTRESDPCDVTYPWV